MRIVRTLIVSFLLGGALLQAACTRTSVTEAAAGGAHDSSGSEPAGTARLSGRQGGGFAALPDRGDLLGYPPRQVVRQDRASTWYRADVSEEHALRAVVTGEMTITAPDGQPIRLRYQRHFEHPNGNWSWIGRNESGEDAVVTFGEKAVFGSVPRGGNRELRLATSGGHSWVVESDHVKEHHPDAKQPDYMVPPELARSFIPDGPVASASAQVLATGAAGTTIDLALGYTTGFANELGGNSQAVTRLQNLVDVTNQAYSNSQINAQIRLVTTTLVSYTDATDNNDALAKLTGYQSGTGTIPVDPAFNALRSSRERYGADLVSLVRRFRTPENKGCGVAWLIGGDQSRIDNSDAPWGYSVVSDDLDRGDLDETDNKTYVCRKETLAHELGHNMGQAHNTEDSDGTPGAHSYSYGYRESSLTGFYTVMAYRLPDSSQKSIRYFANPNVADSVTGRPTGVANVADNARSLGQTMPLIAGFRATVIPLSRLRRDINNDGRDDLLWHNPVSSRHGFWLMNGASIMQAPSFTAAPGYTIAAQGDFNGDGRMDVIWTSVQRDLWMLTSTGSGFSDGRFLGSYPSGWRIVAAGDVNADGTDDLVWHNATGAMWGHWFMSNGAIASIHSSPAAPGYRLVTSGYFNADGFLDLLWTSDAGDLIMLTGNGSSFTDTRMAWNYPAGWRIFGAGDVNGDGRDDLLLRNPTQPAYGYWLMDGPAITGNASFAAAPGYFPVTVADFDGDGLADILWSGGSDLQLLSSTGSGFTHAFVGTYADGWRPIDVEVDPK